MNTEKTKAIIVKFKRVANQINLYLNEENISLNFTGYNKTINQYLRINDLDLMGIYQLTQELNSWANYLGEIQTFVNFKKNAIELECDILKAKFDKKLPNEELEKKIKDLTIRLKVFRLFEKQLKGQQKFFSGAHYHCREIYNSGVNTLTYRCPY